MFSFSFLYIIELLNVNFVFTLSNYSLTKFINQIQRTKTILKIVICNVFFIILIISLLCKTCT